MPIYQAKKIIHDSIVVLCICLFIGICSGLILNLHTEKMVTVPLLLVLVPPFMGIGGNVGSVMGSRISSALHLGVIEAKFKRSEALQTNMAATIILGLASFLFLGFIAEIVSPILGMPSVGFKKTIGISFIAGLLLIIIIMIITLLAAFLSYLHGIDPDDVVVPIVTTTVDFSAVICLFLAANIWL